MPETDFVMPGMTQIMARRAFQRIWHAGHARKFGMPGMPEILLGVNYLLLEPRLLAPWVRRSRNVKFCWQGMRNSVACQFQCKTTLGRPPPIISEQIIDDRHGKNPCMLTNIENVAEMSSIAKSCPRGGFKIQNFLAWMREFSVNSMWSCRLGPIASVLPLFTAS